MKCLIAISPEVLSYSYFMKNTPETMEVSEGEILTPVDQSVLELPSYKLQSFKAIELEEDQLMTNKEGNWIINPNPAKIEDHWDWDENDCFYMN